MWKAVSGAVREFALAAQDPDSSPDGEECPDGEKDDSQDFKNNNNRNINEQDEDSDDDLDLDLGAHFSGLVKNIGATLGKAKPLLETGLKTSLNKSLLSSSLDELPKSRGGNIFGVKKDHLGNRMADESSSSQLRGHQSSSESEDDVIEHQVTDFNLEESSDHSNGLFNSAADWRSRLEAKLKQEDDSDSSKELKHENEIKSQINNQQDHLIETSADNIIADGDNDSPVQNELFENIKSSEPSPKIIINEIEIVNKDNEEEIIINMNNINNNINISSEGVSPPSSLDGQFSPNVQNGFTAALQSSIQKMKMYRSGSVDNNITKELSERHDSSSNVRSFLTDNSNSESVLTPRGEESYQSDQWKTLFFETAEKCQQLSVEVSSLRGKADAVDSLVKENDSLRTQLRQSKKEIEEWKLNCRRALELDAANEKLNESLSTTRTELEDQKKKFCSFSHEKEAVINQFRTKASQLISELGQVRQENQSLLIQVNEKSAAASESEELRKHVERLERTVESLSLDKQLLSSGLEKTLSRLHEHERLTGGEIIVDKRIILEKVRTLVVGLQKSGIRHSDTIMMAALLGCIADELHASPEEAKQLFDIDLDETMKDFIEQMKIKGNGNLSDEFRTFLEL